MTELVLSGLAASSGVAVGPAFVPAEPEAPADDGAEAALAALERVGAELGRTADRLRTQGRDMQADIIEASRLMAGDPSLVADVGELAADVGAAKALRLAIERRVDILAALDDELIAARAADVRELGRRAIRALSGRGAAEPPPEPSIVVARDLGPAELVDLGLEEGRVLGIALAEGAATSHAVIMARALGVPVVAALGEAVLSATPGEAAIVDGATGVAVLHPTEASLSRSRDHVESLARERAARAAGRGRPAVTRDGRTIRLYANASTAAEATAAVAFGAEGIGLVRTELAFLDAAEWPTAPEQEQALASTVAPFAGLPVTVRTLDFGADKTPGFLRGCGGRGIALMLEYEDALVAQLTGILRAGAGPKLRIMLPLVESPVQVVASRRLLRRAAAAAGAAVPALGAMVETPAAATRAHELALVADFLSIGTNDLVATTLGVDREQGDASPLTAAEPSVVELMRRTVSAAHAAGITVEVCGEAAGEPSLTPLFVELGVDELSVSPSRLDEVREAIRGSGEASDELRELRNRSDGVVA
jgi:multiphosphoryl transfer protein